MSFDRVKPRSPGSAALVVAGVVLIVLMVTALAGIFRDKRPLAQASFHRQGTSQIKDRLPQPVAPAFVPSNPPPLSDKGFSSRWAPVSKPVLALSTPGSKTTPVARLSTRTPEGTANIVSILGAKDEQGQLWVHVALPVLPNGTTGWVPRSSLGGYGFVSTRLIVDLTSRSLTLYRHHRAIFTADVGVGKASSPTPTGTFYIRDEVTGFNDPFYGPLAFGTSARSSTLTDWPAGGFIGIHGTNQPGLIPGAISHGCIRLTNPAIRQLAKLMPVGTPVVIR